MSANAFDLGLRLRAYEDNAPVARAARCHFRLRRNADVVVVATMTGEPDAIWGIAYGQWGGQRASTFSEAVPDPRSFNDQVALFSRFGSKLRAVHDRQPEGWYPQVIALSPPAWQHLHAAASRLARVDDLDARYAAEMLMWASERLEHPGSQAVAILSNLFAEHWTAPAPADEDDLLDTWLAAFAGEVGRHGRPIPRSEFDHHDDARTTPSFDERVRKPLAAMARARAANRELQAKTMGNAIPPQVNTIVSQRFARAQRLLRVYEALSPEPLDGLDQIAADDFYTWTRFRQSRERGFRLARQDRFRDAVMGLRSREQAAETWERLLINGDPLYRSRAVHDGRAVEGTIVESAFETFVVRTLQPVLRFRSGTEVVAIDAPHLAGDLVSLNLAGSGEAIDVTVRLAKPSLDRPAPGLPVVLVEPTPDFGMAVRSQGNAIKRLTALTWLHDPDAATPRSLGRPVPTDIVAKAQAARR